MFCQRFFLEGSDARNHLSVCSMLLSQSLGAAIVNVVLFGQSVQSVDARIPTRQAFVQFSTRSHVLITRPMKLDARLVQQSTPLHSSTFLPRPSPPFPPPLCSLAPS